MSFTKKHLIIFSVVVAIASLLLCTAIPAGAQTGNPDEQNPQLMVAKIYANHYGVTVDEAIFRLELQESFPDLGPALEYNEQETFGGLWIQHEPEYKIIVTFTNNGESTIKKYDKYIPSEVAPYIQLKMVNKSLAELTNEQIQLLYSINSQGMQVVTRVDVINNCVSIDVVKADAERFDNAKQNNKLMMPSGLKINLVDDLPVPCTDIYGGLALTYQSGVEFATSGFGVINASGTKGIATAGHIGSTNTYYGGVSLPLQLSYYAGAWDCQWRTCPGFNVQNKVKYSTMGYTQTISATKSRNSQNIGDVVSKFGKTTGFTMGKITSKTVSLPYPLYTPVWIEVSNTYGYAQMADAGDSGASVFTFTGGTAYGILSSASGTGANSKFYYMGINYLSALSVTVMTSP